MFRNFIRENVIERSFMKTLIVCPACIACQIIPEGQGIDRAVRRAASVMVPFQESPLYEFTCSRGHQNRYLIENRKYDLLFQAAVKALLDGYYREAITTFAVALERFYEYAIRVLLSPNMPSIGKLNFDSTWKSISKQSERQLGAYYMLFLQEFRECPILFDKPFFDECGIELKFRTGDPINLRNKVVHDGYIPTREQAIAFGEGVNYYIRTLISVFHQAEKYDLFKLDEELVKATASDLGVQEPVSITIISTFLNSGRMMLPMEGVSLKHNIESNPEIWSVWS